MMVFLNIFGNFTGNLFFGRPPAPPAASVAQLANAGLGSPASEVENKVSGETSGKVSSGSENNTNTNSGSSYSSTTIALAIAKSGKAKRVLGNSLQRRFQVLSISTYSGSNGPNSDLNQVNLEAFSQGDIMANILDSNWVIANENNLSFVETLNWLLSNLINRFRLLVNQELPFRGSKIAAFN